MDKMDKMKTSDSSERLQKRQKNQKFKYNIHFLLLFSFMNFSPSFQQNCWTASRSTSQPRDLEASIASIAASMPAQQRFNRHERAKTQIAGLC